MEEISYRALPSALVEKVEIDVSIMRIGDSIKVGDLDIASNKEIHLMTDPDTVVVAVVAARNTDVEEETADGEEAAENA